MSNYKLVYSVDSGWGEDVHVYESQNLVDVLHQYLAHRADGLPYMVITHSSTRPVFTTAALEWLDAEKVEARYAELKKAQAGEETTYRLIYTGGDEDSLVYESRYLIEVLRQYTNLRDDGRNSYKIVNESGDTVASASVLEMVDSAKIEREYHAEWEAMQTEE